ncbi:MAG: EAL domain-containing protein [Schwartzia sp.]|nr:EAL domain-containing protein [Schwartzia sp. (in: firmicutes)]
MSDIRSVHYSSFYIAAALLGLCCLAYTLIRHRTERRQSKVYVLLLADIVLCALCNFVTAWFEPAATLEAHFAAEVARFIFFVLHAALAPLFTYYILLVCGNVWLMPRRTAVLYAIPFVTTELMILVNPIMGWMYSYDAAFNYVREPGIASMYVAAAAYLLLGLYNLLRYWRAITEERRRALVLFLAVVFAGIIVQFLEMRIQIELFTDALAAMGLMMTVESEDDRIDRATGVYNRRALQEDLHNFILTNQIFHVLGVRITNMPLLHRLMGAAEADAFFRSVADYLSDILPYYRVYYTNPSTFVVLLMGDDEPRAERLASEILARFGEKWQGRSTTAPLDAVIMRGVVPTDFPKPEDVLYMADSPIPEREKKKILVGKDLSYLMRHLEVERALYRGLEAHRFEVYYQPVYELPSLRLLSAEALLRLHDDVLGNIPPNEFIPAAEQFGLIGRIGDFVLEEVCAFIATGIPAELGMEDISVNLSVLQCIQTDFPAHMKSLVARYGVSPTMLNFEITESVAANDYNLLNMAIRELKEHGFKFSMDDYGTGYSNMKSVFSLDFDVVKIDKGILWSAEKNRVGRAILDNSVRMIREMRRKILVEGVETEEQVRLLSKLSVDYLQGFFFSKPVPRDEFIRLARAQKDTGVSEAAALNAAQVERLATGRGEAS